MKLTLEIDDSKLATAMDLTGLDSEATLQKVLTEWLHMQGRRKLLEMGGTMPDIRRAFREARKSKP